MFVQLMLRSLFQFVVFASTGANEEAYPYRVSVDFFRISHTAENRESSKQDGAALGGYRIDARSRGVTYATNGAWLSIILFLLLWWLSAMTAPEFDSE